MTSRAQVAVRLLSLCLLLPAAVAVAAPKRASVEGEVLVKMRATAPGNEVAGLERANDIEQSNRIAKVKSGTLWRMRSRGRSTEALIAALQKNPHVEYVEPNFIIQSTAQPNDPRFSELWGLKNLFEEIDIDAEAAWNVTTGSREIVVGVVDSGVNYLHPDLAPNMWRNPGGVGNAACAAGTFGYNAINRTCDPMDDHYHGSHVAGTIGAAGNNNLGVTGVNWNTSLMALKFLGVNGQGHIADAIVAIDFAVQAKIDGVNLRVLCNSWGGGPFSRALLDVINKANEHDILFVAAAGNDTTDTDITPHYPSSYVTPNMIAVAATDMYDRLGTFSNYGVKSVHLGAPGVGILSTTLGSSYQSLNGTSMAAPHVAGVAALLLAKSPALTTAQVRTAILDNVDPVPALNGKTTTGGRLNAAKVLGAAPIPTFRLAVSPESLPVAPGTSASYTISVVPLHGFTGSVALSVSGLPAGITASFSPASTSTTSTMTISVASGMASGFHEMTIKGTSGAITRNLFSGVSIGTIAQKTGCPAFPTLAARYPVSTPTAIASGDFNRDGVLDFVASSMLRSELAVLLGASGGQFRAPLTYPAGSAPFGVAVADFDADGHLDVVTANSGSASISFLRGRGDGTFAAHAQFAAGVSPFAIAAGDFNRDGRADVAVANNGSSNVSILLGNGDGTFATAVHHAVGSGPFAVTVADLDRDGDLDLAVPVYNANKVAILLGNGNGTFAAATSFAVENRPTGVAVADFDRDGAPDLAVSNYGTGNLSVLRGNGNGTFGAATLVATNDVETNAVTTGDFDADGKPDLAAVSSGTGTLSVLLGSGTGTFTQGPRMEGFLEPGQVIAGDFDSDGRDDLAVADTAFDALLVARNTSACTYNCGTFADGATLTAGTNADAVAAGDFNRDGRADLAVAHDTGVAIQLATGDGMFAAGVTLTAGSDPEAVVARDFNRDGRTDLAVANAGSNNVSLLLGNGDGTFQSATARAAGTSPRALATSDFDRDGTPDLAVANSGSNNVTILLGGSSLNIAASTTPSAIAAADFDRDGHADLAVTNSGSNNVSILLGNGDGTFATATSFAAGTAPSAIAVADFDRDGALDLAIAGSNVVLLTGNGDGTFDAPAAFNAGTNPSGILATDFDRDGALDLAVTNAASHNVSILLGNGRGAFATPLQLDAGTAPSALVALDVNRDSKPDLAVANGSSVSLLVNHCPPPDLTITKTHSGAFAQGSSGQSYTITVTNAGTGASNGTVTVTDVLPIGLRATAISGSGWNCSLFTLTCTRNDVLAAGASHPAITLTVDVAGNAASTLTNVATVSSISDRNKNNDTASDPTSVVAVTDLTVAISHGGSFVQGSSGRAYTIVARNVGGLATSGAVTVSATLPASLTATAMSGAGWSCTVGSLSCTRSDVLGAATSYPAITLTVSVAADAPAEVVATAAVSGGNQSNPGNDTASDPTNIWSSGNCAAFGTPTPYAVDSSPMGLVQGHFNADGRPDLAVVNYYGSNVSILLGKADGTFAAAVHYPTGANPRSIALGDLNADGRVDIVTGNAGAANVSVLLGNGDGTFGAPTHSAAEAAPTSLVVADFDGDGNADVAMTHIYQGFISVLRGTGGGQLGTRVSYETQSFSSLTSLVVADFDQNGTLDLAASSDYGGAWRFSGRGNGTFETGMRHDAGTGGQHIATTDLNRDGYADLIVPSTNEGTLLVLLGNGNGTFRTAVSYTIGIGTSYVNTIDVDGDGHLDILASSSANIISTLRGNGDGTFKAAAGFGVNGPTRFVVGEYNGDGRPDLAVLASYMSAVNVLLGGCADVAITKTHSGNFSAGQTHSYTITVSNIGKGATQGAVTVTDVLPEGLVPVSMAGGGWTCTLASLSCTAPFSRNPGMIFSPITVSVRVLRDAPAQVTNVASVTGGGDVNPDNNTASDPTTIVRNADLAITMSHAGNFAQGQSGRTYTIQVGNIGSAATTGTVSVIDNPPSDLTVSAMSGNGWTCSPATRTCTREDALAIDGTYPPITVTVTVASNAATMVINNATVSGGGDVTSGNNTVSDWTNVMQTPVNLTAAVSSGSVSLSWTAAAHATGYRVLRGVAANGPFTLVGTPMSNTYLDAAVAGNTTYYYRVQATDATNISLESNTVTATTAGTGFTDDPLVANVTVVKAAHIVELRAAVNALRAKASLPAFAFTDASLTGVWIKRVHLTELRTALDEARAALSMTPLTYTDPTPALIRAVHIRELRAGTK